MLGASMSSPTHPTSHWSSRVFGAWVQQLSGTTLRAAPDLATLRQGAADIRGFARNLLGQGVRARQLTELISHLNDLLAEFNAILKDWLIGPSQPRPKA